MKNFILLILLSFNYCHTDSLSNSEYNFFLGNNTWMLVSTLLVFIMHLGFACLETGLTQSKNS